jgi:hypothetical protein
LIALFWQFAKRKHSFELKVFQEILMLAQFLSIVIMFISFQSLAQSNSGEFLPFLFSERGQEVEVQFKSVHNSRFKDLESVQQLSEYEKSAYKETYMVPLLKYLFGPLTYRSIGGVKVIREIEIDWGGAGLLNGVVQLPYRYKGLWMLDKNTIAVNKLILPIPRNENNLLSSRWKRCTDSQPNHQTESFYWYFWDPTRYGCDHKEGVEYDLVPIEFLQKSEFTQLSFPEYQKMLKFENGKKVLKATFAFGYIEDLSSPLPDTDSDIGVVQFRKFISELKNILKNNYITQDIYLSEYKQNSFINKKLVIGKLFKFLKSGVQYEIKVVTNAGVDQMDIFAKSFAHDHDSYFTWLGHSRVGSGFDAMVFKQMLVAHPTYYSVSNDYQLVYWGGCNSYSYYAEPFFKIKAAIQPELDPAGTKSLDIIANALPSLFILNARNALVQLRALMNLDAPTSYQSIIKEMEQEAASVGTKTLAVVLGDEDNNKD